MAKDSSGTMFNLEYETKIVDAIRRIRDSFKTPEGESITPRVKDILGFLQAKELRASELLKDPGEYPFHRPKPPLGVKPRWIVDEIRAVELARAIQDYINSYSIKEMNKHGAITEWITELQEIIGRYQSRDVEQREEL